MPDEPLVPELLALLRCPDCGTALGQRGVELICQNPRCGRHFPVRDGIPELLPTRPPGADRG